MSDLTQSVTKFITDLIANSASEKYRGKPTDRSGRISPGKGTAWFTILGGLIFVITGVVAWFFDAQAEGSLAIIIGLCISGFMAPSLTSRHDIVWNEDGVEGAASLFGPTLGLRRHFIAWNEIEASGITVTQYWYLETPDGRRIYWSYLYNGHGIFRKVIKSRCGQEI